jgi:hypothetical protein
MTLKITLNFKVGPAQAIHNTLSSACLMVTVEVVAKLMAKT